jgi:hypothetical protein
VAIPRKNRRAVGQAIGALKAGGLIEKSDEAVCALARASADILDDALAFGDAKLYAVSGMMRTHLLIVEALRSRRGADDGDNAYAEVIAALASPLGDAPGGMGDADEDPPYWRVHGTRPPWERRNGDDG